MSRGKLSSGRDIDLASVDLDYESFRELAVNPDLSPHERIGFPDSYREGYEPAIFADICAKVPALGRPGQVLVDIGPGCANLPRMLIEAGCRNGSRMVLVDSAEMLDRLPDGDGVVKVPGMFPANLDAVMRAAGRPVDGLICYSVLHYLYVDTNLFDVIDAVCGLLAHGGSALFGDIPNISKRKRFFSSPVGQKFHQDFTGSDGLPEVRYNIVERGKIDDAVLAALMQRAQAAGCDAYLLPQPDNLPMANRRDDLLIRRP